MRMHYRVHLQADIALDAASNTARGTLKALLVIHTRMGCADGRLNN